MVRSLVRFFFIFFATLNEGESQQLGRAAVSPIFVFISMLEQLASRLG